MDKLYVNKKYINDIVYLQSKLSVFKDKTVLISGASGMVGSFFVDLLMYGNKHNDLNCKVIGLVLNLTRGKERFKHHDSSNNFCLYSVNVNNVDDVNAISENVDFVVHAASKTHPVAYATQPIDTILTNVIGTKNLMDLAAKNSNCSFIVLSSVEIYGEISEDVLLIPETYSGYIDCNTLRAGYPESKRITETLSQAYLEERGLKSYIIRLPRLFGPSLLKTDTKAMTQFIFNSVNGQNIVLKSKGNQRFSYLYLTDAVSAIIHIISHGENNKAYNVSADNCNIRLCDAAKYLAQLSDKEVVFEIPANTEQKGFSKAQNACMDGTRLHQIGWSNKYGVFEGLKLTVDILKELK